MSDWIQGDKFQKLANYTYAPPTVNAYDYARIKNTLDVKSLKDGDIIYCVGFDYYKRQLLEIIKDTKKVILISHNCDYCIDDSYVIPDNVVKWYSINVNTDNPKVESIPIGLQNNIWFTGLLQPNPVDKIDKMVQKLNGPKNIKNLVYMDHRIYPNPKVRKVPYDILGNKSFVTSYVPDEKDKAEAGEFCRYLDNVYNHKFVICPAGNGISTHRPWEVLYMGSIPIEIRCINNSYFNDLPICLVDSWEEVTEHFLTNWLIENHNRKWNWDKLSFSFWKNKIFNMQKECR
jgi:hypothetical protein